MFKERVEKEAAEKVSSVIIKSGGGGGDQNKAM